MLVQAITMYRLWVISTLGILAKLVSSELSCDPNDPVIQLLRNSKDGHEQCSKLMTTEPPTTLTTITNVDSPSTTWMVYLYQNEIVYTPHTSFQTSFIRTTIVRTTTATVTDTVTGSPAANPPSIVSTGQGIQPTYVVAGEQTILYTGATILADPNIRVSL